LGLRREAIRPGATFADLVPPSERRRVWARFRKEDLDVQPLGFSGSQCMTLLTAVIGSPLIGYFIWPNVCFAMCACPIIVGIVLGYILHRLAVGIDPAYTLGDAALTLTTADQCRDAEYCLNRKEVFLKVRRVIAAASRVDLDEITPETKFSDLGLE
jgi:hypothetical protein